MPSTFAFTSVLSLVVLAAACGSDDAQTSVDAPRAIDAAVDAPVSSVVEVPCAGATIASEVSAPGFSFTISQASIARNAVVRFTMPAVHSVVSGNTPGVDDGQFAVDFNAVKCLRFTAAGNFGFWCNPHQFTGALTVTP